MDINYLIGKAIDKKDILELALGYLRYESLRKLNVEQFAKLQERNLNGEYFDDIVDELICK